MADPIKAAIYDKLDECLDSATISQMAATLIREAVSDTDDHFTHQRIYAELCARMQQPRGAEFNINDTLPAKKSQGSSNPISMIYDDRGRENYACMDGHLSTANWLAVRFDLTCNNEALRAAEAGAAEAAAAKAAEAGAATAKAATAKDDR